MRFADSLLTNPGLPQVPAGDTTITNLISAVFAIIGALALLTIVISGFNYIFSQGDPEKVARAKNTIVYAAIGLVVSASAAVIVRFVLDEL